jgi:hypothetical protein
MGEKWIREEETYRGRSRGKKSKWKREEKDMEKGKRENSRETKEKAREKGIKRAYFTDFRTDNHFLIAESSRRVSSHSDEQNTCGHS